MREPLAEQLLAEVMEWAPEDVARERPLLQALASYKYDEYQQFAPGMRFVESLAYWLSQFETLGERRTAYEFFRARLIFCSTAEMYHLVAVAYPDHIRPYLLAKAAQETGLNPWHLGRVATIREFQVIERQTLFLGLSDGARTDVFRRANPHLSHEQVRQSHELAEERIEKLLQKLRMGLAAILNCEPDADLCHFRTIVLLDDFSGSGFSYIRDGEERQWDGKVGTFLAGLFDAANPLSRLVRPTDLDVLLVLYMATERAARCLENGLRTICCSVGAGSRILVVHELSEQITLVKGQAPELDAIIEKYYDDTNETDSTRLGGTDLRYGFAGCGLPLILSHNTPNNSIGLLWEEGPMMRPLFPRISRHRDRV